MKIYDLVIAAAYACLLIGSYEVGGWTAVVLAVVAASISASCVMLVWLKSRRRP